MTKTYYDARGVVIGYVKNEANGDKFAYNRQKRLLGYYRKSMNYTYTWNNVTFAKGDSTELLLYPEMNFNMKRP